ncbi:MAG: carboxypeptidase-like regulatory domain-containing protein [Patescibacteria group bacterium]
MNLSGELANLICVSALLYATRPYFLVFKKRRGGFGTVFNSLSGEPESLVSVRLRDLHGQVIRTAVTDKEGRYRLIAPRGEYYIDLIKEGFIFPSIYLNKTQRSSLYDNLLPTQHIIIHDFGAITKNIPIDPVGPSAKSAAFKKGLKLGRKTQYALVLISPLLSIGAAYLLNTWISWSVFAIFVCIYVRRLTSFRPPPAPFGTIRDAETGRPVTRAVVRILDARFNKVLETLSSSAKGRYAFIVHPGNYRVFISHPGYKSVILNYPKIKQDGFLIARDVKLKK